MLSVVLAQEPAGSTSGSGLWDAVNGLASAVERFEMTGESVAISIVGTNGDATVEQLFAAVEGGNLKRVDANMPIAERWQMGLADDEAEFVWLGSGAGVPSAETLVWLMAAIDDDDRCGMVIPDSGSPQWALVRRSTLQSFGSLSEVGGSASGTEVLRQLTHAVEDLGQRVAYRLDPVTLERRQGDTPSAGTAMAMFGGLVPGNIMVGPHTYTGPGTLLRVFLKHQSIVVGNYCSIADECRILETRRTGHDMQFATMFPREFIDPTAPDGHVSSSAPLVIGNDVWMGYRSLVAGPSRIGHGAVTMSGSVVIQNVPDYAVVGGNPAKVLKMRFSQPIIEGLLRIRWWDWPSATVQDRVDWFDKPIQEFVEKFDSGA